MRASCLLALFIFFLGDLPSTVFAEEGANNSDVKPETTTRPLGVIKKVVSTELNIKTTKTVKYDVQFKNKWTSKRHPPLYPSSAHWSPLVLATHNDEYSMWSDESMASTGVKSVAETGATFEIKNELKSFAELVADFKTGVGQGNKKQVIKKLNADSTHTYVSGITMIAPSPDWFAGIHNIELVNEDGNWYKSFTVLLFPYDAGTDSGTAYTSNNIPTISQEKIAQITPMYAASLGTDVFVKNNKIKPVAILKFKLRKN